MTEPPEEADALSTVPFRARIKITEPVFLEAYRYAQVPTTRRNRHAKIELRRRYAAQALEHINNFEEYWQQDKKCIIDSFIDLEQHCYPDNDGNKIWVLGKDNPEYSASAFHKKMDCIKPILEQEAKGKGVDWTPNLSKELYVHDAPTRAVTVLASFAKPLHVISGAAHLKWFGCPDKSNAWTEISRNEWYEISQMLRNIDDNIQGIELINKSFNNPSPPRRPRGGGESMSKAG